MPKSGSWHRKVQNLWEIPEAKAQVGDQAELFILQGIVTSYFEEH